MLKKFYSVAVFLLICCFPMDAQKQRDATYPYFIKKKERAGIIGMQVGFLRPDGSVWYKGYGLSNYETSEETNDSTLFMIASSSKPVTALAILKLYDEGRLDMDTDINRYLDFEVVNPFFSEDSITARMLLAHSSSLKDHWEVLDPLYTLQEGGDSPIDLKQFVKDYFTPTGKYYHPQENFLEKKPGTYWQYCNMGYALLGLLVEEVSGKAFDTFMQGEIFSPLEMKDSYWFLRNIPHQNIANPHILPEKSKSAPEVLKHYGYPDFPDGQLRTTAADYLKFISLILNRGKVGEKQFISEETIRLFETVQFPSVHKYQAVAWNFDEFESWFYYLFMPRLPAHTGGDPGVASVVVYNPAEKTAAVVFTNSPPQTFRGGKILYLDLPKRLLILARTTRSDY